MKRMTKKEIIEITNGGLKLFEMLMPDLKMNESGRNVSNIDSPISNGKKCFSVFKFKSSLYYFKDHYTGCYGDVFEFVARLNKLNVKNDFPQILEIITGILNDSFCNISAVDLRKINNNKNGTSLTLVEGKSSKQFVQNHFKTAMPYLDSLPLYPVSLVKEFTYLNEYNETRQWSFNYSKPLDAYYALTVTEGKFYILFNPKERRIFEWGSPEELYTFGLEHLTSIAYCKNIYLKNTLVITNSVVGLLYLQDKGIPCLALLNGEVELPNHLRELVELFPDRHLLLDLSKHRDKQLKSFVTQGFNIIRSKESYLTSFFEKHPDAIDYILDHFEQCEEYEYIGLDNEIEEEVFV